MHIVYRQSDTEQVQRLHRGRATRVHADIETDEQREDRLQMVHNRGNCL